MTNRVKQNYCLQIEFLKRASLSLVGHVPMTHIYIPVLAEAKVNHQTNYLVAADLKKFAAPVYHWIFISRVPVPQRSEKPEHCQHELLCLCAGLHFSLIHASNFHIVCIHVGQKSNLNFLVILVVKLVVA